MGHRVTFVAKAAMDRKVEAARVEAAAIFNRQFGEKFVPTSKAERKQAATNFLKAETFAGRPVIVINRLTGKQLTGKAAAEHMQDVNEATRLFNFQQRTEKDPLDPANRTLSRDESRALRQRDIEFSRRAREKRDGRSVRDPFKTSAAKARKSAAKGRQSGQSGTARQKVLRTRPKTRKT